MDRWLVCLRQYPAILFKNRLNCLTDDGRDILKGLLISNLFDFSEAFPYVFRRRSLMVFAGNQHEMHPSFF